MWGETFDDFENEEREMAVAKETFMKEPARGDFTFPTLPLGIQVEFFSNRKYVEFRFFFWFRRTEKRCE